MSIKMPIPVIARCPNCEFNDVVMWNKKYASAIEPCPYCSTAATDLIKVSEVK